jgi:membrane-bound lytic murein transglycosylase F
MPLTMKKYNITHESSVEEQLEAGGKLLVHLDHKLSGVVTDSLERVNFVLASYNAGMSRVMNFREQALQNGNDPNVWADNVELYSPKQTILFVKEVTERFAHYKTIAK